MGYSTFCTHALLDKPEIQQIAERYGVSLPQLCIRYSLEHGVAPIVQSLNPTHIADNLKVDFSITNDDIDFLDKLPNLKSDKFGPSLPYEGK
jgi:Aldo/keto reductases, related to diketogulonate reductase